MDMDVQLCETKAQTMWQVHSGSVLILNFENIL